MLQSRAHARTASNFLLLAAAMLVFTAACSSGEKSPTAATMSPAHEAHAAHKRVNNGDLTPEQLQAIAQVRNATRFLDDTANARRAGYTNQFPAGCVQTADGRAAQGFHFMNEGLVDDKVELLRPELVMYEPQPNGTLQLVGVDYVVPLGASEKAPTLLGQEFVAIDALGVWALHIWAWRPNPDGLFAMFNPSVSCALAR